MKVSRGLFIKRAFQILGAFMVVDVFGLEKFFVETNEFFLGKASRTTQNIKLLQLSDLHLRAVGYLQRQIAEAVNKLKPDLILLTGDSIDKADSMALLKEFLNSIDPKIQ